MSSEDNHGIRKQPPPTCAMIDRVLAAIRYADRVSRSFGSLGNVDELEAVIDELRKTLLYGDIEGEIEAIRANAEAIREWGDAWKGYALELVDRLPQDD